MYTYTGQYIITSSVIQVDARTVYAAVHRVRSAVALQSQSRVGGAAAGPYLESTALAVSLSLLLPPPFLPHPAARVIRLSYSCCKRHMCILHLQATLSLSLSFYSCGLMVRFSLPLRASSRRRRRCRRRHDLLSVVVFFFCTNLAVCVCARTITKRLSFLFSPTRYTRFPYLQRTRHAHFSFSLAHSSVIRRSSGHGGGRRGSGSSRWECVTRRRPRRRR